MSLTNPKDVITEERLSEFYQGILPYLGGMPEMLANKFSKGDLYSTDEKMIGQWIDGKPLYQITLLKEENLTSGTTYFTEELQALNIDFIQQIGKSMCYNSSSNMWESEYVVTATTGDYFTTLTRKSGVVLKWGTSRTFSKLVVVIRYTKTTDQPISIGVDTDYSTTEKVIGTWIDGKPIYQKSIEVSSNFNAAFNISNNIDVIIDWEGVGIKSLDIISILPYVPYTNSITTYYNYCASGYPTSTKQWQPQIGSLFIADTIKIIYTFKYTKTTDIIVGE